MEFLAWRSPRRSSGPRRGGRSCSRPSGTASPARRRPRPWVSCIRSTSGSARLSHFSTASRRAFREFTFQVAIRIGRTIPAAAHPGLYARPDGRASTDRRADGRCRLHLRRDRAWRPTGQGVPRRVRGPGRDAAAAVSCSPRRASPSTIFAPGHSLETWPELAGAFVASGHEIGVHGWFHEDFADLQSTSSGRSSSGRSMRSSR